MGETTGISWTDATFNPWIGCSKVSPGCAHCYAETLVNGRMGRPGTWGEDGERQRTSAALWRKPIQWEKAAEKWFAEHGHRRRVFCASLADVFEPRPELEPWRRDLFELIEQTPSLDWQLLTKRPEEARDWLRLFYAEHEFGREWVSRDGISEWGVLPNVWIGTSIESTRFTWRADALREIPASVRFISAEPLLGSLYEPAHGPVKRHLVVGDRHASLDLAGIDWLIVGGESGGKSSRPMNPQWARDLRDACVAAGVAFHFKQWGSWAPAGYVSGLESGATGKEIVCLDGSPTWRTYFRGTEPKAGGKILDGREWCEIPDGATVLA